MADASVGNQPNGWAGRGLAVAAVGAAALAGLYVGGVLPSGAQDADPSVADGRITADLPPEVRSTLDPAGGFDPTMAALGITEGSAEFDFYRVRQLEINELAAQAADDPQSMRAVSTPGATAVERRAAFHDAIDNLYERVAGDPSAAAARASWVSCMDDAGYTVESPDDFETALSGLSDAEVTTATAARTACDDAIQADVDAVAISYFPGWYVDHEATITAYADAVFGE